MKKPKVLVVASTYPFNCKDPQPRFIQNFSDSLVPHCDLHVLVPSGKNVDAFFDSAQSHKVHRFRYFFRRFELLTGRDGLIANLRSMPILITLLPLFALSQFFWLIWVVRRNGIDIVNAHWIIPQGVIAALARPLLGKDVKLIVTSHGGDLFALKGKLLRFFKRWTLHRVDRVTVVSQAMKEVCVKHFQIDPSKIVVRSMGVDLTHTFFSRSMPQAGRLIFVGRLVPKKGLLILLEAMRTLKSEGDNYALSVVGGGYHLNTYRDQARKLEIEDAVEFVGAINNELIPQMLSEAEVAIFPFVVAGDGDQEGLGLTTVEAMGCGCVVIASALDAVKDVVKHGETGFLFEPGDSAGLARLIKYVMETMSAEDKQKMTLYAREYALKNFDKTVVAQEYAEVYESLLREKSQYE